MIPGVSPALDALKGIPRESGDDPNHLGPSRHAEEYSPRERG